MNKKRVAISYVVIAVLILLSACAKNDSTVSTPSPTKEESEETATQDLSFLEIGYYDLYQIREKETVFYSTFTRETGVLLKHSVPPKDQGMLGINNFEVINNSDTELVGYVLSAEFYDSKGNKLGESKPMNNIYLNSNRRIYPNQKTVVGSIAGTSFLSIPDIPLDISLSEVEVRFHFTKAYTSEENNIETANIKEILAMAEGPQDVYFDKVSFTKSDNHLANYGYTVNSLTLVNGSDKTITNGGFVYFIFYDENGEVYEMYKESLIANKLLIKEVNITPGQTYHASFVESCITHMVPYLSEEAVAKTKVVIIPEFI